MGKDGGRFLEHSVDTEENEDGDELMSGGFCARERGQGSGGEKNVAEITSAGGEKRPGAILRVTSSTYFRVNDNYYPAGHADLAAVALREPRRYNCVISTGWNPVILPLSMPSITLLNKIAIQKTRSIDVAEG